MENSAARTGLRRTADGLTLIGALILMVAVSVEIISGDHTRFSASYLLLQLLICCAFLFDWLVRWTESPRRGRFLLRNLPFLLLSIPWLNLFEWSPVELTRPQAMAVATMPVLRSYLALYVVVRWMVEGRAQRLLAAYIVTVILFTYLSALLFFDYETGVNPHLQGFGNALWWAWMNVTTVGAALFPVTTVGKIICVLLPIVGMAMFPIFTVYVTSLYARGKRNETPQQ